MQKQDSSQPDNQGTQRTFTAAPMSAALQQLWIRFLPEMRRRVAMIESAACSLGTSSPEQREAAHQAAHKLAGSLGTFGAMRGTEIARRLEEYFAHEPVAEEASEILLLADELRGLVGAEES